ncbi:hypothetical protein ACFQ5M_00315 [Agrilactobacillus yilanensis]|uniref:Uncharacterized protein n=1 Tax=Agrilactobacillus yilanensis TaxID=2485997 RepID=A0ABW4J4D1_9LACO|nr:hypothetical protein [Agrilactobacillus yilanensis]
MAHKSVIYYLSYIALFAVIALIFVMLYHLIPILWHQVPYAFELHFGGR